MSTLVDPSPRRPRRELTPGLVVSKTGPAIVTRDTHGLPTGRLGLLAPDLDTLVGTNPVVYRGEPAQVLLTLLGEYDAVARNAGVRDPVLLIHSPIAHEALLLELAHAVGWRVTDHKRLYRHAGPPRAWEPPSSGLAVRPWRLDDDGAALVGHADGLDRPAALRLWSTLLARGAATNPATPEGWFVAESRGRPVAFALPGWLDAERRAGTNLFLGVMPEWRGAGLGTWVQALVVQSLRDQGARDVLGSTNHDNLAMQRVFERTGYRPVRTQRFFRRR